MARPRKFDPERVLDQAMDVFWRHGYDGASLALLCKAMGMSAPSLYAAFGDKRALFQAVLERYAQRRAAYGAWVAAGASAREVAERMLFGAVVWLTDPAEPPGCLHLQVGAAAGAGNEDVICEVVARQHLIERQLTQRLERAQRDGDLAQDAEPAELARYLQTVFAGLGVLAAQGAGEAALRVTAMRALKGWPD